MNQNQEKISLESLTDLFADKTFNIGCTGLSGSEKAYFVSKLYIEYRAPIVIIVPSAKDAEKCIEDLHFFLEKPNPPIIYFPSYNILPFKYLSYHNATAAMRISSLYRLVTDKVPPIVVTTVDAFLKRIIPKQELCDYAELIMTGEEIDREQLIEKLISGGYVRSMIAEEPGDFCIRGGILDIFSPLYSDPLRIELLGDSVESVRFFSAANQRTIERIQEAVILPARETILKMERINNIISRIRKQASKLNIPVTSVRSLVDRVKKEGVFPGIESLIPLIYPFLSTFFDYSPDDAIFVLTEPIELEQAVEKLRQHTSNSFEAACNEAKLCVEPDSLYLKWSEAKDILKQKKLLTIKKIPIGVLDSGQASRKFNFSVKDNSSISMELKRRREKGLFAPIATWVNDQKQSEYLTLLVCSTRTQAGRLRSLLVPYGIHLEIVDDLSDVKHTKRQAYICIGQISSGPLF